MRISCNCYIYSKSMKTHHLYFRYLSNTDLSINSLFSSDNYTLHILSNDQSLHWLVVNMHCFEVLVTKQVIWPPCNVLHEWFEFLYCALLADWVDNIFPKSKFRYLLSISNFRRSNLSNLWTILELVAAVSWKVFICPVYEPLLNFICTWHWYKNKLRNDANTRNTNLATLSMTSWIMM